jgi:hypothetical protein
MATIKLVMTIHDEIILKLIDPDKTGKATGYITQIVGSTNLTYNLEELYWYQGHYEKILNKFVRMSPDIFVHDNDKSKNIAIELENDEHWDFGHSLRQVRKYRKSKDFDEVVVIIPKKYERFAILYAKHSFRVYLWKATRVFGCNVCGQVQKIMPSKKCIDKDCIGEVELTGVKEVEFTPFEIPTAQSNDAKI